jgi:hypothetical protein
MHQRTQLINAMRSHLAELGIIAPQGREGVKELLAIIANDADTQLPNDARASLIVLAAQLQALQTTIGAIEKRIVAQHRANNENKRIQTVPGIGVIGASAIAATVPNPKIFRSGRDFAAWIGLVPRQLSTGGKPKLGSISKQGDRYLRRILVVGAVSVIDIRQRGLEIAPDLAVGDGALGFWKAIEEVFPNTRHQRCWVHKTANVLNKVAISVQVNMKADLREIYGAPTRSAAEVAIDVFADKYGAKYDKAVACLTKDRETLLAFFDFPAEHWDHLRTSNPIESVFATVRHRTVRTKGALSAKTAKLMVFKLVNAAAKTWRRLNGENQLPKVVKGVKFQNGIEVTEMPAHHAA